jgi:hypothetical protein
MEGCASVHSIDSDTATDAKPSAALTLSRFNGKADLCSNKVFQSSILG